MVKLVRLLQEVLSEIGDATKEPYSIETVYEYKSDRLYQFTTDSGTLYEVEMVASVYNKPGKPIVTNIQFGTFDKDGELDFDMQTGDNDIYKVMATIAKIVKEDSEKYPTDIIQFSPSKREGDKDLNPIDNVRTKLYIRYIKAEFPDIDEKKDVKKNGQGIRVRLPK